jgi:hypothetical protein
MEEQYDWINASSLGAPKPSLEPPVDKIISEIVGFKVYLTDPRILKTVVKFKRMKKGGENTPDNFLQNPEFIKAIKEAFIKPL